MLDAIEKSSKVREDIFAEGWGVPATFEGQIVKTADAIAYINHDILDGIRAGIITERDLPDSTRRELGTSHSERIDTLVCDIVEASWATTGKTPDHAEPVIRFSPRIAAVANELREFMFRRVYYYDATRQEAEEGKRVVIFLFRHFVAHPEGISRDYSLASDAVERRAADFVSGMTDRYAIRLAAGLGCADAERWASR